MVYDFVQFGACPDNSLVLTDAYTVAVFGFGSSARCHSSFCVTLLDLKIPKNRKREKNIAKAKKKIQE